MHCDDKRTLYVLRESIEKTWKELHESDFTNQKLLKKLNQEIQEYFEYKKSSN